MYNAIIVIDVALSKLKMTIFFPDMAIVISGVLVKKERRRGYYKIIVNEQTGYNCEVHHFRIFKEDQISLITQMDCWEELEATVDRSVMFASPLSIRRTLLCFCKHCGRDNRIDEVCTGCCKTKNKRLTGVWVVNHTDEGQLILRQDKEYIIVEKTRIHPLVHEMNDMKVGEKFRIDGWVKKDIDEIHWFKKLRQ